MRIKALVAGLVLSWAATSLAQGAPPPPPQFKFELHGFVGGTLYMQDQNMGPGPGGISLYNNAPSAAQPVVNSDRLTFSGDVRQTRLNFSLAGPAVLGGATPKAVVEIDFFGNYGAGNYGDVSLTPRMRLAYGELNWGANRLQFGQQNDLTIGMIPVSLAHIAFPVSYDAGTIGWRRPGFWGYHTFGDVADKDATKVEFAWGVGRSQWADGGNVGNGIGTGLVGTCGTAGLSSGGCGDSYGFNLGEASGLPAIQARLTLLGGVNYSAWVTGFWERLDRNGVNNTLKGTTNVDMDLLAGVVGAKFAYGPLSFAATGYVGKNLAPLVGEFLTFQPITVNDVHEFGGWTQVGWNFTKELSVWYMIGTEQMNRSDAVAAGMSKVAQVTQSGMIQYRDGGWAFGLEYVHMHTLTNITAAAQAEGVSTAPVDGDQFLFTGIYFF